MKVYFKYMRRVKRYFMIKVLGASNSMCVEEGSPKRGRVPEYTKGTSKNRMQTNFMIALQNK
jgi:hypothetical protein